MKKYENPVIVNVGESEGIYMASGEEKVCKFGRTEFNPGADGCQSCVATGGVRNDGKDAAGNQVYKEDIEGKECPENMPKKK